MSVKLVQDIGVFIHFPVRVSQVSIVHELRSSHKIELSMLTHPIDLSHKSVVHALESSQFNYKK